MAPRGNKQKKDVSNLPRQKRAGNYGTNRLVNAVGIIVICVLVVVIFAQHLQQRRAAQQLAEYEVRIEKYEMQKEAAKKELERLQDLGYIEVLARNRLGLVKPDETIYQIED